MPVSRKFKKALLLAILCDEDSGAERNRRSEWVKPWLAKREKKSSYATIFRELSTEDPDSLCNYLRMNINVFHQLLEKVTPLIQKEHTHMRDSISPGACLEATLRFLATGCSYKSLQYTTRISQPSLSAIIPRRCEAIFNALKDDFMNVRKFIWVIISEKKISVFSIYYINLY